MSRSPRAQSDMLKVQLNSLSLVCPCLQGILLGTCSLALHPLLAPFDPWSPPSLGSQSVMQPTTACLPLLLQEWREVNNEITTCLTSTAKDLQERSPELHAWLPGLEVPGSTCGPCLNSPATNWLHQMEATACSSKRRFVLGTYVLPSEAAAASSFEDGYVNLLESHTLRIVDVKVFENSYLQLAEDFSVATFRPADLLTDLSRLVSRYAASNTPASAHGWQEGRRCVAIFIARS